MRKKAIYNVRRIDGIRQEMEAFGIPYGIVTENAIEEKRKYWFHEFFKLNDFWNWKFNNSYKGDLGRWAQIK